MTTDELVIAVPPAVALAIISLVAWYLRNKKKEKEGDKD